MSPVPPCRALMKAMPCVRKWVLRLRGLSQLLPQTLQVSGPPETGKGESPPSGSDLEGGGASSSPSPRPRALALPTPRFFLWLMKRCRLREPGEAKHSPQSRHCWVPPSTLNPTMRLCSTELPLRWRRGPPDPDPALGGLAGGVVLSGSSLQESEDWRRFRPGPWALAPGPRTTILPRPGDWAPSGRPCRTWTCFSRIRRLLKVRFPSVQYLQG